MLGNGSIWSFFQTESNSDQPVPQKVEPSNATVKSNDEAAELPATQSSSLRATRQSSRLSGYATTHAKLEESPSRTRSSTDDRRSNMPDGLSAAEASVIPSNERSSSATAEDLPANELSPISSPDSLPSEPLITHFRSHNRISGKRSRSPTLRRTSQSANTSFGSNSTLTTLPPSSQISQSSSRRIHLHGEEMVTNSSSDIEPLDDIDEASHESTSQSESESDSELAALIASKRRKLAEQPPTPQSLNTPAHEDRQLRSAIRYDAKRVPHQSASPPRKVFKHNLAALLKQKKKDEELSLRLQELERTVASYAEAEASETFSLQQDMPAGKNRDSVLQQDGETNQRLKQAMQRVDALEQEVKFHFFDVVQEDVPRHDFPGFCLPDTSWAQIMRDKSSRDHFILCGFARDIALFSEFPSELQEWMLGEILFEHREGLSLAYVGVLEACSTHNNVNALLDMPMLADCLQRLGTREQLLRGGACLELNGPEATRRTNARVGQRGLLNFLALLAKFGKRLQDTVRHAAFYYLALMLIDNTIMGDGYLTKKIQDCLSVLIIDLNDIETQNLLDTTGKNLLETVQTPVLFAYLTSRLPSSAPATSVIRRKLALSFLLDGAYSDPTALTSPSTTEALLTQLSNSSSYTITSNTDYTHLGALITLLDIATGAGFSDFAFLDPAATPTNAESAFNAQIDALVAVLKNLSSHIRDAGAAHMRRTECKGAIDRLVFRLQYAVRTKAKVKKGVFGSLGKGAWTGMEGQRGGMERFVKKEKVG